MCWGGEKKWGVRHRAAFPVVVIEKKITENRNRNITGLLPVSIPGLDLPLSPMMSSLKR